MTRYVPSRHYLYAGLVAIGFGAFSVWSGLTWAPAFLAAGLFLASAVFCLYLASRPSIEIHETHLAIGRNRIPWVDLRRLDRKGWLAPLLVQLTLSDNRRVMLLYPGDLDSVNSLLRSEHTCGLAARYVSLRFLTLSVNGLVRAISGRLSTNVAIVVLLLSR